MEPTIYDKFSKKIERAEYKNFYPTSKFHFNESHKRTEFNIDFGDGFCSSKFQFYISGSLTKSDGTAYAVADKNIKLIDNFVPFLFSKIEVKKHNKMIEEIEYPGQLSTIKGTITYSQSQVNAQISNGFKSEFRHGKFEAVGNLSHFGLGFFENIDFPIYKGGFNICFIRDLDDNAIFRWKTKNTDGTYTALHDTGKITIDEFFIRVPIIEYLTLDKIELVDEIKKQENILFAFHNWQCIREDKISGTTFSFDITNIYRNIKTPQFVIIGFQQNRLNNQEKDPSKFDSVNIKNFKVKLNGLDYPDEMQNLNISDGIYRIMYQQYQEFKKVCYGNSEMYHKPDDFINNSPLCVIDTSKRALNLSTSKNDIIVNIDFQTAISSTSNVICYIVVVSKKVLAYNVLKNDIREIE